METHRTHDLQAAERIFKKVVHPGLESLRLVDRNGIAIHSPINFRQRSFVLSPRGVPTRVSTHVYSGHHSHAARYSEAVNQNNSPDIYTEQSFVVPSAYETTRSAQQYGATKKHSYHGRPPRHMQVSKSASSERFLSSVPDEKRFLQSAGSRAWNRSSQSVRLEKEWANVANSRALKRNSEIVSHRVDRMYFMNGNSIKLQPRYQVDEDQLNQLRELSKSRQSSRQHHRAHFCDTLTTVVKPENEEPVSYLDSYSPSINVDDVGSEDPNQENHDVLQKEIQENETRASSVEVRSTNEKEADTERSKLKSAPSHMENQELERSEFTSFHSCHMCESEREIPVCVSEESGIQEDDNSLEIQSNWGDAEDEGEHVIQKFQRANKLEVINFNVDNINIFDILSHQDKRAVGDCMLNLMKSFPPSKKSRRSLYEKTGSRVLVSGLKKKRAQKGGTFSIQSEKIKPQFKTYDKNKKENIKPGINTKYTFSPDFYNHNFPKRKLSSKVLHTQKQSPLDCKCRTDSCPSPDLQISGIQVPLYQLVFSSVADQLNSGKLYSTKAKH